MFKYVSPLFLDRNENDMVQRQRSPHEGVTLQKEVNKLFEQLAHFERTGAELGLGTQSPEAVLLRIRDRGARARGLDASSIEARIAARTEARNSKDFAEADRIRDELAAQGVELLDGPEGTGWTIMD